MPIKHGYFTPILGSVAAAVAIAVSPIASAAPSGSPAPPQQPCAGSGSGTVCQSPGNVQIDDAPPADQFHPYAGEAFLP
jgi:hypothetical protein